MRKAWTDKEESYLYKKYNLQPVELTAKRLKRSVSSVKHKANRLGINNYLDFISVKTLASCFNSDSSVVNRWIKKFGMPVKRYGNKYQDWREIDPDEFWVWAYDHRHIIDWNKYERYSLIPEPHWLERTIKKNKIPVNNRKRFTENEIKQIKLLLQQGKTHQQIAEEVGRTLNSIRHLGRRIYRM